MTVILPQTMKEVILCIFDSVDINCTIFFPAMVVV